MGDMVINDTGVIDEKHFTQVAFAESKGSLCNIDVQGESFWLGRFKF